jgi:hypothetical protein
MLWFIKAVTLVFNGVMLQFVQLLGLIGLATAVTAGLLRAAWWAAPIIALAFALIADYLPTLHISWLDKVSSSSERFGFLVIVYFVISTVGWLAGRYIRFLWIKSRAKPRAGAGSQ